MSTKETINISIALPFLNPQSVHGYPVEAVRDLMQPDNSVLTGVCLQYCDDPVITLTPMLIYCEDRLRFFNLPTYSKIKCSKALNERGFFVLGAEVTRIGE